MPNSRHRSVIASPSRWRATKRKRSSITEQSLHGINTSSQKRKSVTYVSGTFCYLCLRSVSYCNAPHLEGGGSCMPPERPSKFIRLLGSSVSEGASASQAEGREFEPRRPLQ